MGPLATENWINIAVATISCLACLSSFIVAVAGFLVSLSISKRQNSTSLEISKIESKVAIQVSSMQVEQQKRNLLFEPKKDDMEELMNWIEDAKKIQQSNDKFRNMRNQGLSLTKESKDDVLSAYNFFREWDMKFRRIERLVLC